MVVSGCFVVLQSVDIIAAKHNHASTNAVLDPGFPCSSDGDTLWPQDFGTWAAECLGERLKGKYGVFTPLRGDDVALRLRGK